MKIFEFLLSSADIFLGLFLSGCQMSYLMRSAYNHLSLMNRRVDIQTYLQRPNVSAKTEGKIQLVLQAREFAEKELGAFNDG